MAGVQTYENKRQSIEFMRRERTGHGGLQTISRRPFRRGTDAFRRPSHTPPLIPPLPSEGVRGRLKPTPPDGRCCEV